MSFKKSDGHNFAAPPEIVRAVVELAKLCAAHGHRLDNEKISETIIAQQEKIMQMQREQIRRLELRLDIDQEL